MLRSNRASVPSVVRSLYIKKKDKFRIQMYKEIKENLINISSSILSVQNKMVNVYYKGNIKGFGEIYSSVDVRYQSKI